MEEESSALGGGLRGPPDSSCPQRMPSVDAELAGVSPMPEKPSRQEAELPAWSGREQRNRGEEGEGLNRTSAEGGARTRRLLLHRPRELARGHLGRDFAQRAPGGAEYPGQGGLQSPEPEGEGERCIQEHKKKCTWGLLVRGSLRIPQRLEGCSANVAKPRSPLLRLAEHSCTSPLTAPSFSPGAAGRTAEEAQPPAGEKRGKKPPRPLTPSPPPPWAPSSKLQGNKEEFTSWVRFSVFIVTLDKTKQLGLFS